MSGNENNQIKYLLKRGISHTQKEKKAVKKVRNKTINKSITKWWLQYCSGTMREHDKRGWKQFIVAQQLPGN